MKRCEWAGTDKLYQRYHDKEWGVPVHNDKKLFEFLILEGAQAGLSWITVLKKRQAYQKAFDRFDFNKVSGYRDSKVQQLMGNAEIIRKELKIKSAICYAHMQATGMVNDHTVDCFRYKEISEIKV